MHANPTLQLIRLASHPTLTQISENTGFPEIDLLMIEIINLSLFLIDDEVMVKINDECSVLQSENWSFTRVNLS